MPIGMKEGPMEGMKENLPTGIRKEMTEDPMEGMKGDLPTGIRKETTEDPRKVTTVGPMEETKENLLIGMVIAEGLLTTGHPNLISLLKDLIGPIETLIRDQEPLFPKETGSATRIPMNSNTAGGENLVLLSFPLRLLWKIMVLSA